MKYTLDELKNKKKEIIRFDYDNPEECLEAVKQNGYALQFVKDQTEEICLVAVKQNGNVLRYVKDQTPEICLAAVKQNGWALEYVKDLSMLENIDL